MMRLGRAGVVIATGVLAGAGVLGLGAGVAASTVGGWMPWPALIAGAGGLAFAAGSGLAAGEGSPETAWRRRGGALLGLVGLAVVFVCSWPVLAAVCLYSQNPGLSGIFAVALAAWSGVALGAAGVLWRGRGSMSGRWPSVRTVIALAIAFGVFPVFGWLRHRSDITLRPDVAHVDAGLGGLVFDYLMAPFAAAAIILVLRLGQVTFRPVILVLASAALGAALGLSSLGALIAPPLWLAATFGVAAGVFAFVSRRRVSGS